MGTEDIEEAINSTAKKMEDLRKVFEFLHSHSSSIISFAIQWKDIEDHFSSIEKSIAERFRELKELDSSSVEKKPALMFETKENELDEVQPRPELKALCVKMDGEGLISFITENRRSIADIRRELGPALLSAPDPVTLVLDSLDSFSPPKNTMGGEIQPIRRTCASILECFNGLSLEIRPQARDRARKVALEWKGMIKDGKGDNGTVALGFLHLVAAFGVVESFDLDYILDLLVLLAKRKFIIDLCRSSALVKKMPNLIDKLNNSGKQLDAVKFVLAFNLHDKYPPASLLKAYIKESKRVANEIRTNGNNSLQSKNVSASKEIEALKSVIKTVEEYKLGSAYPCENLQKRIEQLERQKTENKSEKKRAPAAADTSNKRLRPSNSFAPVLAAGPLAHYPTQLGHVDRASYANFPGSYSSSTVPSLFNQGSSSLSGNYAGLLSHAPPKSYMHLSESLPGSAYYNSYNNPNPPYSPTHYP